LGAVVSGSASGPRYLERQRAKPGSGRPHQLSLNGHALAAGVLLAAAASALLWANLEQASYEAVWRTVLSVDLGGAGIEMDLRHWVNSGLMTVYFFVFGLEARRELDLGEFRERRRFALSLVAALAGMASAVLIYLAFNGGQASAAGWAIAMSTDTAFAVGFLALVGPRFPDRLRAFLLTIVVVDDLVALVVIGTVYTEHVVFGGLLVAVLLLAAVVALRALGLRNGITYALLGGAIWIALLKAGVEPVVAGLAMGLATYAYPAARTNLQQATERFREFREQPTPKHAHAAREGVRTAISPNDRLQDLFQPITSFLIVPVFALANAGIVLDKDLLSRGLESRISLGIFFGYVVGKPLGIVTASWIVARLGRTRLRPPVGWLAVAGIGTLAGIGFTVSLLVATLAFEGQRLEEAKLGILAAAVAAFVLTWSLFRAVAFLPRNLQLRALLGTDEPATDLATYVEPRRDHVRGRPDAPVTIVEYGDFECPYCGLAEPTLRKFLAEDDGDIRYVWRHLPLTDVHPNSQLAAEAAEAAAAQGAFWPMHDLLLDRQRALGFTELIRYAEELGLDVGRFSSELSTGVHASRVAEDVDSADLSGVSGTPTFFINGHRHYGSFDVASLSAAARAAGARKNNARQ
jgi:Na+/H+ antiporter NhaA